MALAQPNRSATFFKVAIFTPSNAEAVLNVILFCPSAPSTPEMNRLPFLAPNVL